MSKEYDVLIEHLRECAKADQSENTFLEAAEAIEEMGERLAEYEEFDYLIGHKCQACGGRFKLRKENKYLVQAEQGPFGKLAGPAAIYDAYDCPVCGSQNRVNVRYPEYVPDVIEIEGKEE